MRKFICALFFSLFASLALVAQTTADVDESNSVAESLLNQKPNGALEKATKAKTTAENLNYPKGKAKALALMGVANYKIDAYEKAKILITEAISLSAQIADTSTLSFSQYWLANIELNRGQYGKALDLYQSCLQLATSSNDKKNIARCLDGKGSIYESLNEDSKALEFYNQSLQTAKDANFKEWYGTVIFEIANLDYKQGKLDEALKKYEEAVKLSEETHNLNNKASCLQQMASVYYDKKDTRQAMKFAQQAMDLFQQTGSSSSYSHCRLLMSYIMLGERDYSLAADLATISFNEGKTSGEIELQKSAAEVLYYAYLYKGDKAKALDYHVKFHELSEKNHNEELAKKLTQLELQANFEKEREVTQALQAKKNTELNAQIQQQKLIKKGSIIGAGLLAIIAGLAVFAFFQKRRDTRLIASEKNKSDELLQTILPVEIASELKASGYSRAKNFEMATVLFADIKALTGFSEKPSAEKLETETDFYFNYFDEIVAKYKIEKIKTFSDGYLCVGGLPIADHDNAYYVVSAALEMLEFVARIKNERLKKAEPVFEIRIGIHTGPLIAGIVGIRKFSYDVWGDTVNVAARMEQHGEVGKVNISGCAHELIKNKFTCTYRGKLEEKSKGPIEMYFVDSFI